jgi:NADH dehydrogenase FAD-containing subunit
MGNSFRVLHTEPDNLESSSSFNNSVKKKTVVIIGGGYAGLTAARRLTAEGNRFNVILIERRDYFYYNVPSERALVSPELIDQLTIPYDRLQSDILTIIKGEVVNINPDSVVLRGHESTPLSFDYCLLATGSTCSSFPAANNSLPVEDMRNKLRELSDAIKQAQNIVIVGGGATGVQLAGEIGHDFNKSKAVTLVSSHDYLVGRRYFTPKFQNSMQKQLQSLGVEIVYNERVLVSELCNSYLREKNANHIFGTQTIQTNTGRNIATDLVIFATGGQLNINPAYNIWRTKRFKNNTIDINYFLPNGRLKVNYYFQLHNYENIFACGDLAGVECKNACNALRQGEAVANNIINLLANRPLIPYIPCGKNPRTAITIGRKGGVIQVHSIHKEGKVIGARYTAWLKSKNLFCDKAFQHFGLKYDSNSATNNNIVVNSVFAERDWTLNSPVMLAQATKLSLLFKIPREIAHLMLIGKPNPAAVAVPAPFPSPVAAYNDEEALAIPAIHRNRSEEMEIRFQNDPEEQLLIAESTRSAADSSQENPLDQRSSTEKIEKSENSNSSAQSSSQSSLHSSESSGRKDSGDNIEITDPEHEGAAEQIAPIFHAMQIAT